MNNTNKTEEKHITLGFVAGWVLGILFVVPAVVMLFSEPFTGLLFLIIAALLLPPVNKFVKEKYNVSLSGGLKAVLIIVLLIIVGMQSGKSTKIPSFEPSTETNGAATETQKQYQQIFTFSGNGMKKSEAFTISGDRFKIAYDCQGDYCGAFLYKVGSSFPQGIMNSQGSVKDETIIYTNLAGPGEYYIDANTIGNFTMIVYDYK